MWDYESQEPFSGGTKNVSEMVPERSKNIQSISKIECELCGGNHERRFSLEINITSPGRKDRFPNGKSRSVDYSKSQWRWPPIWRPAQSVNGRMNLEGWQCTTSKLIPENMLELGPEKDQLEMGHRQILSDSKTKAWVDEQNKINIEKTLRYDKSYDEARDTMHPDPQFDVKPPIKSKKKDTAVTLKKEKDAPKLSRALQEFVKHIADPLVDKVWKRGAPGGAVCLKLFPMGAHN